MLSFVRTKYSDQPGCNGGVQLGTDFGVVGVRQEGIHHWPNLRSIASWLPNGEMTHSERLKPGGKGWGRNLRAWNCLQVHDQPQHLISGGTGAYNFLGPKHFWWYKYASRIRIGRRNVQLLYVAVSCWHEEGSVDTGESVV